MQPSPRSDLDAGRVLVEAIPYPKLWPPPPPTGGAKQSRIIRHSAAASIRIRTGEAGDGKQELSFQRKGAMFFLYDGGVDQMPRRFKSTLGPTVRKLSLEKDPPARGRHEDGVTIAVRFHMKNNARNGRASLQATAITAADVAATVRTTATVLAPPPPQALLRKAWRRSTAARPRCWSSAGSPSAVAGRRPPAERAYRVVTSSRLQAGRGASRPDDDVVGATMQRP